MNIEQKKLMHQQAKNQGFDDPVKLADELEVNADAASWLAYPNSPGMWANAAGLAQVVEGPISIDRAFKYLLSGPWLRLTATDMHPWLHLTTPNVHEKCRDELEAVQDAAATYERRIAQARAILDGNA